MVSQHRTFGVDSLQVYDPVPGGPKLLWLVVETEYAPADDGTGKLVPVYAMEWARTSSEWRARTIAKALTDTLGEWK